MIDNHNFAVIRTGLDKLQIDYSEDKLKLLKAYLEYLVQENRRYNLIGTEEIEDIISKHFLDCLAPLSLSDMDMIFDGPVIDLGTGAGLPGIIWAIFNPGIDIYLLDSRRKKVDFLKRTRERLELDNCYPFQARVEDVGQDKDFREKFKFVTARAVAKINVLLEYALPLVKISGKTGFFKGPAYQQELVNSEAISKKLGGSSLTIKEVNVPGLNADRYMIFAEKIRQTPGKYPRQTGIPKKRPL